MKSSEDIPQRPPRCLPPGYEWIAPWATDAPQGETITRLLNDPRMQKPLRTLQTAKLHEGIDQQAAIRELLCAASMPHEFFG
ncbi:hypothetical protein CCP4SC76_6260001 [Gammaproteobacteria bacterium]